MSRTALARLRGANGTAPVVATVAAVVLGGCRLHDVDTTPDPPVTVPDSYRQTRMAEEAPETWWGDFNDPRLGELIEASLAQNLQLRSAWAQLEQVRAVVVQAGSAKWPQLDANLSASRNKNRFDFGEGGGFGGGGGELIVETTTYDASLQAGYEVDLWKRVDSLEKAAALDAEAARDNVEAAAISVAAQVSETWYDIVAARARKDLIEEQLEVNETFLELTTLRFEQGLASALEVYQQRQQLVATRAQLTLIEANIQVLEHAMSLLLGRAPGTSYGEGRTALPELPPLPGAGVPADLLERRPDVRAARRRIVAADYRVAAAIADRLPTLRLSGSLRESARTIGDLLRSPLWTIAAAIGAPVFDGGRREAEVDRTEAVVKQRAIDYGQTLLQAMVEVENALVQERQQDQYITELEEQVTLAEATLREARARYRQGLVDYLQVLTSLQALQQVELNLLQARRQRISYRIQLCRALGGTWTQRLAPPEPLVESGGGATSGERRANGGES